MWGFCALIMKNFNRACFRVIFAIPRLTSRLAISGPLRGQLDLAAPPCAPCAPFPDVGRPGCTPAADDSAVERESREKTIHRQAGHRVSWASTRTASRPGSPLMVLPHTQDTSALPLQCVSAHVRPCAVMRSWTRCHPPAWASCVYVTRCTDR